MSSFKMPQPYLGSFINFSPDIPLNKLKCCEFKGKQASKIESTSLCCRSYSVLHVYVKRMRCQSL